LKVLLDPLGFVEKGHDGMMNTDVRVRCKSPLPEATGARYIHIYLFMYQVAREHAARPHGRNRLAARFGGLDLNLSPVELWKTLNYLVRLDELSQ
jgi:hypothetical protein